MTVCARYKLIIVNIFGLFFKGGGVQAKYFGKHDFEIMVDPKSTPNEPNCWLGLESPDQMAPPWRQRPKIAINGDFFLESDLGAI